MKFNRLFFVACTFVLSVATMQAAPRTPEQAMESVRMFMHREASSHGRQAPDARQYRIAATTAAYYAVNTGDGFVIAAADDRMQDILGWSENGTFVPDNMPPALMCYLQGYEDELRIADSLGIVAPEAAAPRRQQSADTDLFADEQLPLLTTEWGQGTPYNNLCPQATTAEKCPTGCVATAMAQVMNYWEYPSQGTGSHSYYWKCSDCGSGYKTGKYLSASFGSTTYNWANMLDTYPSNNYTTTEASAVATLMYHCGVAVDMSYGYGASGAQMNIAADALYTYFGYGKDLRIYERDEFTTEELQNALHNELASGRPLLVGAVDVKTGGHAFVCDGYARSGHFHFNWGWNGTANGYFRIGAMNPIAAKTVFRYNSSVMFVGNIHPDSLQTTSTYQEMTIEGLYMNPSNCSRYDSITVLAQDIRFSGTGAFTGRIGFSIYNEAGDRVDICHVGDTVTLPSYGWGWSAYSATTRIPDNLPDGTYTLDAIYQAWDETDIWHRARHTSYSTGPVTFYLKGDNLSSSVIGEPETDYSTAADMLVADTITTNYYGAPRTKSVTLSIAGIKNISDKDFFGYYGLALYDKDHDSIISILGSTSEAKSLRAEATQNMSQCTFTIPSAVARGEYRIQPVYKGTGGEWQPIVHANDMQPIEHTVLVGDQTFVIDGLLLGSPVSLAQGESVGSDTLTLLFTIPKGLATCKLMLAMKFSNDKTAQTGAIEDDQPYTMESDNWNWGVDADTLHSLIQKGALAYDTTNHVRLMWKLDPQDTFRDLIPAEYGICSFRLTEGSGLPDSILSCSQAAAIAANLEHNVRTQETYTVIGWITEMLHDGISRGQQRFWMADSPDGGQVFQCYWGNVTEEVVKGDKVAVTGPLMQYNGTPEISNGTVELLSRPSAVEDIPVDVLNQSYEVYDIRGYKVGTDIQTLTTGVYIIRQGAATRKIVK